MSVFNDFQRLWSQRFPEHGLITSSTWEQEVRDSLERHKLRIAELSKELEQENHYVEYLENLLSDVVALKSGGDPSTLLETTTSSSSPDKEEPPSTSQSEEVEQLELSGSNDELKSSLNLRESNTNNESKQQDKNSRLSLNTDNKYTTNTSYGSNNNSSSATRSAQNSELLENVDKENKDFGSEKDNNNSTNDKNGALQKCINELAAANINIDANKHKSAPAKTASHFVTVIEVKESKGNSPEMNASEGKEEGEVNLPSTSSFSSFDRNRADSASTAPLSQSPMMSDLKKKMPPRPPPKHIRRVEPPTIPGQLSSSPKRDTPFAGSSMVMPLPSNSGNLSSSESPGNSLERNIKPSDILRQKTSSEIADAKALANNRKTTSDIGRFAANAPELLEEFGRKLGKSERTDLNASQNSNSSTSSLGRTASATMGNNPQQRVLPAYGRPGVALGGASPTGSLSKTSKLTAVDSSSNSSLEKKTPRSSLQAADAENVQQARNMVGSKESLASQGISEIIKSYESVSSQGSDNKPVSWAVNSGFVENEPYYDTVPLDGNDGEYVYIKPGGTGSSSSRDDLSTPGSTLAMGSSPAAHMSSQTSVTDPESPGRQSNYVNIDYFLHGQNNERSSSMDSDGEGAPPIMRAISQDEQPITQTPSAIRKNLVSALLETGNARGSKIRLILSSIIQSETIYVECLNKMIQYKKAIHATLGTSQPVIKEEEENTIFFKIEELYETHSAFLSDLKTAVSHEGGDVLIGGPFKRLADMFNLYSAFLHNYNQAIETVKKCSANNPQFKKIVSTIVLNLQTEQSLTLEDLLHKPVARVQINAMVFTDLLHETPSNHPDHQPLRQAHKIIHMFLKQFNVVDQTVPSESNRNLRRMVKNSFIVELVDGHRKLRHLFLFNDVIACAKYKSSTRERMEFELKWFVPLKDVKVVEEAEAMSDLKETSPANILQLKTQACTVRDQLLSEEKDDKGRKTNGVRSGDKYRRKLSELELQLVLSSPNLVLRLANTNTHKNFTFFLSSDFERTQWIESILSLKRNCNIPGASAINALEVNAFIVAMQKSTRPEMGSYLMRSSNDERLLVGDLHLTIQGLSGLDQAADLYLVIEVDSYGHYYRKATTKIICRSISPLWNENFVLELEGSQNVRIILYEDAPIPILRSKHVLTLNRSLLQETSIPRMLKLGETLVLNTLIRFVPGEVSLQRVPTAKPGALFGAKMSQVLKREKRDIPFIISACIREVERRGMAEVGIYRVSGSASDLAKLKKSFETNAYEAEQLLKDVDIHSVTGILKSYLRELPEALFSDLLYPKFFETFSAFSNNNETARINELLKVFEELPTPNKAAITHILDHLIRVHHQETDNKMSLHNLAMVFGPTLLRPGQTQTKQKDLLASSTVDVMAQAGILYCFLQARIRKE